MFALLLTGNDGNDDKDDYDDGNDDKGRGGGWGARSLDQGGGGGAPDGPLTSSLPKQHQTVDSQKLLKSLK